MLGRSDPCRKNAKLHSYTGFISLSLLHRHLFEVGEAATYNLEAAFVAMMYGPRVVFGSLSLAEFGKKVLYITM